MSYTVGDVDYETLPAAMLDLVRQHMRVAFNDDDETIAEYLRWSISYAEESTGLKVFDSRVDWYPEVNASRAQCPMQPVSAFAATVEGVDVSSQYRLERTALTAPTWFVRTSGDAIAAGILVALTVGYADQAKIPPGLKGNIIRTASTLYEFRESVTSFSLEEIPGWCNDILTGLWVPRV